MKAYTRANVARTLVRSTKRESVEESIGEIRKGMDVFTFSKGQYSLGDAVAWLLEQTGPADVTLSTWTAAHVEIESAWRLMNNGAIRSLRWLVDFSFPRRQPGYCDALRERFGDDVIRLTKNHAKFVLVRNESWDLVLRTSMNLNENPRFEYLEVSESAPMAEFLAEIVGEVFQDTEEISLDEKPSKHESQFFDFDKPIPGSCGTTALGITLDDPRKSGFAVE
jgi:hypothetical protein